MGGKFEAGETPEECDKREVQEETGLAIQNPRLHGLLVFTNFKGNDWYVFVFTATEFKGELTESSTEGKLEWIDDDKLTSLNLWESDHIFFPWIAQGRPFGVGLPLMEPRIWSSEEINWNIGYPGEFLLMATGDPLPTLELFGDLPEGLEFVDNGDGTATVSGTPTSAGPGCTGGGDPGGEGDPDGGDVCGEFAFTLVATNSQGVYAQALGMTVYGPAEFITGDTATFTAGSASSFTVAATSATTPILYTWAEEPVMAPDVQLVDHENGFRRPAGHTDKA